jgi:opine dehydrogenase
MSNIAFIGSGNSGQAMAADCKLGGATVRMFEFEKYQDSIKELINHKTIEIWGPERNAKSFKRNGTAKIDLVSTNIEEVIKGAKHIVFTTRANAYEEAFREAIPFFEDGQVISFLPDNYGSLILRKKMREMGCTKKVVIGGWTSMPFGARITEKGVDKNRVYIMYRAVQLRFDTLPSCDAELYLEQMKDYPPVETIAPIHGDTMLDIGFSNVNPILHVPATIYNAGVIENWGVIDQVGDKDVFFDIYRHGFSPSVSKIQWKQYQEECAIARALGVGIEKYNQEVFFARTSILGPEFMGDGYMIPITESIPNDQWMYYIKGEKFDLNTRYITEDLPIGCKLYHELGMLAGVETPMIDAMIQSASVLTGTNYFEVGFDLDLIGISKLNHEQLLDYLRHGDHP